MGSLVEIGRELFPSLPLERIIPSLSLNSPKASFSRSGGGKRDCSCFIRKLRD
ncbi:unnamed protein product [Meloidogyne enterolobii]|uniref:Uncharacterized protein n=1 Tax=Meloidogyne enterolobii TaxID=390850 RepID=A0ACB1AIQ5_MELEN